MARIPNYSDSDIMKWIASGNESENNMALRCLYDLCHKSMLYFIRTNSGTEDDAKDLLQDSIIVFYEQVKNHELVLNCSVKTYIYSIARNLWLKRLKADSRFVKDSPEFAKVEPVEMDLMDFDSENKLFQKMFEKLGKSCREILILYYYEKLSMKEIMKMLNLATEQSAKNKKYKCMNSLREIILSNKNFMENYRNG